MSVMNELEFLDLIDKHKDEFYRFAYRRVWNNSDAEDVFADAVMVAWERRGCFQIGTNFRAWFYRILLNKSFVANRQYRRNSIGLDVISELDLVEAVEDHQTITGHSSFLENVGDEFFVAFSQLRLPERICLLLRAMDCCTYKEIAGIMDIPVGTVMTHLSRGRKRMRLLLPRWGAKPRRSAVAGMWTSTTSRNRGLSSTQSNPTAPRRGRWPVANDDTDKT